MFRASRTRVLAACLLAPLLAVPSAHAEDAASGPRYAVFSGSASPRTGGDASRCFEILSSGPITPFTCEASFELTLARGLCAAAIHQTAGYFNFFSPTTGQGFYQVRLTTTAAGGTGYLVGGGIFESRVLHVRIFVGALCGDQATGPFEGHLAYL